MKRSELRQLIKEEAKKIFEIYGEYPNAIADAKKSLFSRIDVILSQEIQQQVITRNEANSIRTSLKKILKIK